MSKDEEKSKPKSKLTFLGKAWVEIAAAFFLALGFIGFLIGCYALFTNGSIDPKAKFDLSVLSDFGGLIAGLSGLFTLGSVLLFYRALSLQREDIRVNLEELSQTREVFLEQSKTQKLQQFESTFSILHGNLIDERRWLKNAFKEYYNDLAKQYDNYFSYNVSKYKEHFNNLRKRIELGLPDAQVEVTDDYVLKIIFHSFIKNSGAFKIYLNTLKLTLDYLGSNKEINKELYLNIIKSGINQGELQWLYFFSTYHFLKDDKYKSLAKKLSDYGFFQDKDYFKLDPSHLIFNKFPPK